MSKLDKKQRHRVKREAKRREMKRRDSVSPIKRLAISPGETEYWISEGLEQMGQLQAFVYKRAAGLTGIACFLVDRGVVGLKDTWTRFNINREEFNEMIENGERRGIVMRRATVEEIQRVIAGAIRWTHENGMRLPKDWKNAALFIGGVDNWMSADVSMFAKEFAGHPEDLRQRLMREPFETYIRRSDIDFIFSDGAPYTDQASGKFVNQDEFENLGELERSLADEIPNDQIAALSKKLEPVARQCANETADWLTARNETPSPELLRAWGSIVVASAMARALNPDSSEAEVADLMRALVDDLCKQLDTAHAVEHRRAIAQGIAYIENRAAMIPGAVAEVGEPGESATPKES